MKKRLTIATFAVLACSSLAANAAPETEGGWTEEPAPAAPEAAPETASAETAPPEAASESEKAEKPEAKPNAEKAATPTAGASDDVRRDNPPNADKDKAGVRRHDGFYLRGSLGGGSLRARGYRYDEAGNRSDYDFTGNAISGDIMVGGTPAPGVVIGGAYFFNHAARSREESRPGADPGMSFGLVGPFVDFYPNPRSGFHLGGALGGAATITYDDNQEERVTAVGFGGSAWVGYDFWVGDQWSLGGLLRGTGARVETHEHEDAPTAERDRLGVGSVSLLVSAVYH